MRNSTRPKIPAPPTHLSAAAKRWWKNLNDHYVFDTPDSLMTLGAVMENFDRMTTARLLVEKDGAVVLDRFGQSRAHPAVVIERDARGAMLKALRQLQLDVVPPGTLPIGRPPAGR